VLAAIRLAQGTVDAPSPCPSRSRRLRPGPHRTLHRTILGLSPRGPPGGRDRGPQVVRATPPEPISPDGSPAFRGAFRMPRRTTRDPRRRADPAAVERYLARVAPGSRRALRALRAAIRAAAPDARERISYGIPTFWEDGALVYYAAFTNHLTFFAGSGRLRAKFPGELADWPGTESCIHFGPDRPIPRSLVRRIVRWRIRENRERRAAGPSRQRPARGAENRPRGRRKRLA
jgi:uncharacterized protein YdhG (YjbR/CyaY superfamily)